MIKEIALDPRLFAQWPHHLHLRDAFGVEKGRVIAAFSRKWKGLVRDEVNRLVEQEKIGPVKAQSVIRWLQAPAGVPDVRLATSKGAYDGGKAWHLNAADAWKAFDAILSQHELETPNAILADDDHEYVLDPRFSAETQRTIPRRRGPMVDCVWPLLRDSRLVKLVEPHFNPNKKRFREVLEAMLDRLRSGGGGIPEIELHIRHPGDKDPHDTSPPGFTVSDLKRNLSPLLCSGWSLRVHLWTRGREKMHPRYLLTDRGGIQIDHGWDEGEQDSETTPIHLLSHSRWEQEMARYRPDSADFRMNPATDLVVVD